MTDDPRNDDTPTATAEQPLEPWRLTGRDDLETELAIRAARLEGLQGPAEEDDSC